MLQMALLKLLKMVNLIQTTILGIIVSQSILINLLFIISSIFKRKTKINNIPYKFSDRKEEEKLKKNTKYQKNSE